jgi:hypothetical protein
MPNYKFPTTLRNALGQKIIDACDAGTGSCKFKFYGGSIPADGDTAIGSQTLLGTLTASDPVATVTGGVVTFAAITQDSAADATGTASFAAVTDSDDVLVCYLDVTNEAGTGAIKINTVSIYAGGPIQMNSFAITMGGA